MADKIQEQVNDLLRSVKVRRPPVPVKEIAKAQGITIASVPATDDISGALIRHKARAIIAVNTSQHSNRQRFTIAHELGHFFLHEGLDEHVDQNFRIAWRSLESSSAVNWLEIEANRFAAELLMPGAFLRKDLDQLRQMDNHAVALLASRYRVSAEAMKFRLINLGVLPPYE